MAIESQKANEKELQEEVPKKTLETSPFKHPLTEQLLYKPPPPLRPSLQPSPENSAAIEEPRKEDEAPKEIKSPGAEISMGSSETSDLQKKVRRAERFGMPVQLSEEEKRNSRAERFGTAPTLHGSDGNRKSEEQKRKARAERFGLAAHSTSDEEAKKKARVARFGSGPKPDTLEEDKRKARAIRFSETSPSAPSQTNGKANSELVGTVVSG